MGSYQERYNDPNKLREMSKLLLKTFKEGMNNAANTRGGTAGQI